MTDSQNRIEVTGTNIQIVYFHNYLIARRQAEPVTAEQLKRTSAIFSWTGDPGVAEAAQWAVLCGLQVVSPPPGSNALRAAEENEPQISIEVRGSNYGFFYLQNYLTAGTYAYYNYVGKQPPDPAVTFKVVDPMEPVTAVFNWTAFPTVADAAQRAVYAGLTVITPSLARQTTAAARA